MAYMDNVYWDLLNNDVRLVDEDLSESTFEIQTVYRSIRNQVKFFDVCGHEEFAGFIGRKIGRIEEADSFSFSESDIARISHICSGDINFNPKLPERTLHRLFKVYDSEFDEYLCIVAGKMKITING